MRYFLNRKTRARSMRLEVALDGEVVVTAPARFSLRAIEDFMLKHASWLEKHVAIAKRRTIIKYHRGDIPELKRCAAALAAARLAHFSKFYNFSYNKISIRAQKSRWGSCSEKGNLSFNYRLAILPPHLVDYIVVHELCHLQELNHSPRFWALVSKAMPNYDALRKELHAVATACVSKRMLDGSEKYGITTS